MSFFAVRNFKEILRDRLNLVFGLGFPVIVLLLLTLIQSNIPIPLFELERLSPGIAVFGLSFISLFSGMLIARDRCESFLARLMSSPLRPSDYIFGYLLPLLPLALGQILCCFAAAFVLGLRAGANALLCIAVTLPSAVLFAALGLLCGALLTDRQVGGVCGALLTNLSAWLSGTWFDLELLGGTFRKIAFALPFANAVEAGRAAMSGSFARIMPHLWVVLAWTVFLLILAIAAFSRRMRSGRV